MRKESLVAEILASYAFIIMVAIFLYALIDSLGLEISLATNLLTWSAAIFAPVVLLMTYDSWRSQKASDVIAIESKTFFNYVHGNHQNINCLIVSWGKADARSDYYAEKIKERYSENLEYLNLYVGLLQHISDTETFEKIGIYINKLGLIFNNREIDFKDSNVLSGLKELKVLGCELQKIMMNYILHKKKLSLN